jgi:secondary thiamine-phosphate synthase enzyme
MVFGTEMTIRTKGYSDIINVTGKVSQIATESKVSDGIINISVIGSTASVSTIEFEPALTADFKDQLERFIPQSLKTRHSETWGDDNGFSHIRATYMGPSITIPISKKRLVLGTWQQIIVIDHDNRPRSRRIFVQIIGE